MLMTYFPANCDVPGSSGLMPAASSGASPVVFGSREIELDVGYVAARIRLLTMLHSGWMADSSALADLLVLLPVPSDLGCPPGPRFVRVRLQEPVLGNGMITFPLSWGADDDGRLRPVLDLGLTLRAGLPRRTYLRLDGTVWLPAARAIRAVAVPSPASPVFGPSVEAWLSRLARSLTSPAGRPSGPSAAVQPGSPPSGLSAAGAADPDAMEPDATE